MAKQHTVLIGVGIIAVAIIISAFILSRSGINLVLFLVVCALLIRLYSA